MWVLKFVVVFLIVWGIWYVLSTLIFAANEVANGSAPAPIMIGIIVALFVTAWVMKWRKLKGRG